MNKGRIRGGAPKALRSAGKRPVRPSDIVKSHADPHPLSGMFHGPAGQRDMLFSVPDPSGRRDAVKVQVATGHVIW